LGEEACGWSVRWIRRLGVAVILTSLIAIAGSIYAWVSTESPGYLVMTLIWLGALLWGLREALWAQSSCRTL